MNKYAHRAQILGPVAIGILTLCALLWLTGCRSSGRDWTQWGGPNRNFMVEAPDLAEDWPEDGPPALWERELGDGYSTIIAEDDRLYTMYRKENTEYVVALDAKTGETIWEHSYESPHTELMDQFGPGPHSTPLIIGNRLYTMGVNVVMHCLNKRSGRVFWKRDLVKDYGAPVPDRGYACSPIGYGDTVIVPVDRHRNRDGDGEAEEESSSKAEGQSLMAFDQKTGELVWKSQDFQVTYSSPVLIERDGQDQLVVFMAEAVAAVDPSNGELIWKYELPEPNANLSSPLWTGDDLIVVSAAYASGTRVIRLHQEDERTVPEELWYSRKMRIHHANPIRIGDYIYGSSGDFGPAFFMGMNVHTGEIAWRERGFAKATCVYADGKVIILDEDGHLALATVSPEGLNVLSKCKVTEPYSWAAPTLVGSTLYVRDRERIMALDLS